MKPSRFLFPLFAAGLGAVLLIVAAVRQPSASQGSDFAAAKAAESPETESKVASPPADTPSGSQSSPSTKEEPSQKAGSGSSTKGQGQSSLAGGSVPDAEGIYGEIARNIEINRPRSQP